MLALKKIDCNYWHLKVCFETVKCASTGIRCTVSTGQEASTANMEEKKISDPKESWFCLRVRKSCCKILLFLLHFLLTRCGSICSSFALVNIPTVTETLVMSQTLCAGPPSFLLQPPDLSFSSLHVGKERRVIYHDSLYSVKHSVAVTVIRRHEVGGLFPPHLRYINLCFLFLWWGGDRLNSVHVQSR